MLEVSGDQDTPSWVQGAAQGVVTGGGYLGLAGARAGPARSFSCEAAGHSARVMAWILDCLFASAFEPRPRRGEWGPPRRGAAGACPGAGTEVGVGKRRLQPRLGALGLGTPPTLPPLPLAFS